MFGYIFKQRIPEAEHIGFIVYLAIGFWPWLAFSDSLIKSITNIEENKDLLGKISLDYKIPVIASISATFLLNIVGYLVVLIGLIIFAESFYYSSLPLLIFPIFLLYLLSIALGLFLSAMQVFIKDTLQLFTTIITLWFFLTPILYSESILPDTFKSIIKYNPLYVPLSFIHKALITGDDLPWISMIILVFCILIILFLSIKFFNKLSNYFVDNI